MNKVDVYILGQKYTIKGEKSKEYVENLAAYIDEKLRKVYEQNPNQTPLRAAILGCFYIADELQELKEELENKKKELEEIKAQLKEYEIKTDELFKILD